MASWSVDVSDEDVVDERRSDLCARMISAGVDLEGGIDMNECNIRCKYLWWMNDNQVHRSGQGKWKTWRRGQNALGNCGTVPRNGTGIDDEYDPLCVVKMVSVSDPNTGMARDVQSLDGVLQVWKRY